MSSGQKAWAEECENEVYVERLRCLESKSHSHILDQLERAYDDLRRISSGETQLSRVNWARLDYATKVIRELIDGK